MSPRISYGPHPSQFAELSRPAGRGPFPVVVMLHGGFWRTGYGLELGRPLAADLTVHGVAVLNVEYRRVGADPVTGGGGWPTTCADVAAAVDALADRSDLVDVDRVVAVGHSAGGQLAGWLAARGTLPEGTPGAAPAVRLRGFVSQAGLLDLVGADNQRLGGDAVADFMGGSADAVAETYALASPMERLPTGVPGICVHGTADDTVPLDQSERYVAAATRAGDNARLVPVEGAGHYPLIDVSAPAWATCRAAAMELLG